MNIHEGKGLTILLNDYVQLLSGACGLIAGLSFPLLPGFVPAISEYYRKTVLSMTYIICNPEARQTT